MLNGMGTKSVVSFGTIKGFSRFGGIGVLGVWIADLSNFWGLEIWIPMDFASWPVI